jgi:ssDNA-binding Zn-finger/Zn-ribbon topoisomerase 1
MTAYRPRTLHSDFIIRPDCPKCGKHMNLFGIEPEKPGHELRTFVCPKCNHIETALGKIA